MKRHFAIGWFFLLFCAFAVCDASGAGVVKTRLVSEQAAQTLGLTRAWFAQVPVDCDREEITTATLLDGTLFTTTDSGLLTAFDAESGAFLWNVRVGSAKLSAPGVNSKIVAILSGTELVVFDRFNGKRVDAVAISGLPASAPVVSEREIYVPLFSQRVFAFSIKQKDKGKTGELSKAVETMRNASNGGKLAPSVEKRIAAAVDAKESKQYLIEPLAETNPYSCPSLGVATGAPVIGTQSYDVDRIGWTTDKGWLLIGEFQRREFEDALQLLYKLQITSSYSYVDETRIGNRVFIPRDDVSDAPFYLKDDVSRQSLNTAPDKRRGGLFIVGSKSGRVFAMNDANGKTRWMFLANSPVSERIFAFGQRAYVPTKNGEFFALALADGTKVWQANDIQRFVAASATRLYAIDGLDRLVALDKETGARVKALKMEPYKFQLFNGETDRIYVVSEDGLIQCLRETQQVEPLRYAETCAEISARIIEEMDLELENETVDGKTKAQPANVAVDASDDFNAEEGATSDEEDSAIEEDEDSIFDAAPATPAAPSQPSESAPADDEEDPFAANVIAPLDGNI